MLDTATVKKVSENTEVLIVYLVDGRKFTGRVVSQEQEYFSYLMIDVSETTPESAVSKMLFSPDIIIKVEIVDHEIRQRVL